MSFIVPAGVAAADRAGPRRPVAVRGAGHLGRRHLALHRPDGRVGLDGAAPRAPRRWASGSASPIPPSPRSPSASCPRNAPAWPRGSATPSASGEWPPAWPRSGPCSSSRLQSTLHGLVGARQAPGLARAVAAGGTEAAAKVSGGHADGGRRRPPCLRQRDQRGGLVGAVTVAVGAAFAVLVRRKDFYSRRRDGPPAPSAPGPRRRARPRARSGRDEGPVTNESRPDRVRRRFRCPRGRAPARSPP